MYNRGGVVARHPAEVMYEVARDVLDARSLDDVVARALEGVQELVGCWRASVGMVNFEAHTYTIYDSRGQGREHWAAGEADSLSRFGGDLELLAGGQIDLVHDLGLAPHSAGRLAATELRSQLLCPILDGGVLVGTLNLGSDRTHVFTPEHVTIARELADLLARAIRQVRYRDDLVAAHDVAIQSSAAKSAFLGRASHELRTPLNAILGYIELIAEEAEELGAASLRDDLDRVHGAGSHLLRLVDDLLDLAGLETGRAMFEVTDVRVDKLLDEVLAAVRPLTEEAGVSCDHEHDARLVWVHGDPVRLRQVLYALVEHALDLGSATAIHIVADCARLDGQDWARLAVKVTGEAVTTGNTAAALDAFSRAPEDPRPQLGTGLGIAISRRYCRMMDGDVKIEAQPGRGATLTVLLPAPEPNSDAGLSA